jgi:dienelactone hydrolase
VLIKQLVSHGFVVVGSLSSQTLQGTPLPQVVGVDYMIQENDNPASPLYHHLDTAHIGATGHSQGGAATTVAGADPRITAIAPIAGSRANVTLHGPAALLCGAMDTTVPCTSVQSAYDSISTVPVMRVHLMGDTANRSMFYDPSCKLCTDTQHWKIQRKMMDQ